MKHFAEIQSRLRSVMIFISLAVLMLLYTAIVYLVDNDTASERLLYVSSLVRDGDVLAAAATGNTAVIAYDAETTTLDQLLTLGRDALAGRHATSIGFAVHDYGEGIFYLTGSHSISLGSTLNSEEQRAFWRELGSLIVPGGRIDLLACNLAASDRGQMLLSSLANVSGVEVAASTDDTGNEKSGGDWVLEYGGVKLIATYFDAMRLRAFDGLLLSVER